VADRPQPPPGAVPPHATVDFHQVVENVHPADRDGVSSAVRQAIARNEELDIEYRMLRNGEVRWMAARGQVEPGGEQIAGVALDITTRKAAELQAEQDRAALAHMGRVSTMGQLSASIAHQLNQPLAAILGNAEVARRMLDREPPDLAALRQICDDIVTEDNRAADVIRRLSALYRRGEMMLAQVDLNELVRETLDMVRTELLTRHVLAVTELAPTLPMIAAGRVQLQQVLLNLILNAADAMAQVEATERRVLIRTDLEGPSVRLFVVDRGTGIAAEHIGKVFDPFWSTKAGGIGVGLAICRSIVGAHRGTLTVANNAEGGATFCAIWPLRLPN
jgi:C4-dicarboxylate-specific signal transduction histidine kinase